MFLGQEQQTMTSLLEEPQKLWKDMTVKVMKLKMVEAINVRKTNLMYNNCMKLIKSHFTCRHVCFLVPESELSSIQMNMAFTYLLRDTLKSAYHLIKQP
jgi:hypothetical protein